MRDERNDPLVQTPAHTAIQRHLSACWAAGYHAAVCAPFGFGKTLQVSVGRALWEIGRNPAVQGAVVTNIDSLAKLRISLQRSYIADDLYLAQQYHAVFPRVWQNPSLWNAMEYLVVRSSGGGNPTFIGSGVAARNIGRRLSLLMLDDFCDPENSLFASDAVREDLITRLIGTWLSRFTDDGRGALVFTPWHQRDASFYIVRQPQWSTLRLPIRWEYDGEGRPVNPRIEAVVYNPPPGYDLGVEGLNAVSASWRFREVDPQGESWPVESCVPLGTLQLPAAYSFIKKYQDMGGGRGAELRLGLEPVADEEVLFRHILAATIEAEPPQGVQGGVVGIDISTSASRRGNAAVRLAAIERNVYAPVEVVLERGNVVAYLDQVEAMCARAGGPYPAGPLAVFEVNAQQKGIYDIMRQPEYRDRWPCLQRAVPHTTDAGKHDAATGIQSMDTLFETGALRIFKPKHSGSCQCGLCVLYRAMRGLQHWQLKAAGTPDTVMAHWFATLRMRDVAAALDRASAPARPAVRRPAQFTLTPKTMEY